MTSRGKAAPRRGDPRRRGPDAPGAARGELANDFAALHARYRALADERDVAAIERSDAATLALAAMRASVTALAAIQGERCVVRNERWRALASRAGRWQGCEGADGLEVEATLERLAVEGAARLVQAGASTCAARWEEQGGLVVELWLERVSHLSPPVVLAMASDVSERVRREREVARTREVTEAQERLRVVGELASGVAHDLNNTLHAVTLRLTRLQTCVGACPEHAEDLRVVERITAAAQGRIRRLQELVSRRAAAPAGPVDLGAVVATAAEVVRDALARPGRAVDVEVRLPRLPPVLGDDAELDHVFLNLLGNAGDAMPGGGRIEVTGRVAPDGLVEVSVADEGTGVPPELVERIFEPFFSTKGRRGTGLGLCMVRSAVTRLGGSVCVENRRRGGARFTLRLPPAPAAECPAPAAHPDTARPEGLEVLVVDDDPDNLEAMRLVLEGWGQKVQVTHSGRDAIGRVEGGARPDLVLCDLGLGDASGWEVAQRVRSACPATRVVIVTGWAEEISRDDPRRGQVVAVLPKPVQPARLLEVLGRAARRGRLDTVRPRRPAPDRTPRRRRPGVGGRASAYALGVSWGRRGTAQRVRGRQTRRMVRVSSVAAALVLLLAARPARACSVCGCGDPLLAASDPAAITSTLRLQVDAEYLRMDAGTDGRPGLTDRLTQWSWRLNVVYRPLEALALTGTLPVVSKAIHTVGDGADRTASSLTGLGDAEVGARYALWTRVHLGRQRVQELAVSAGASIPTGAHDAVDADGALVDPHGQLGTGGWGPFAGLHYRFEQGDWTGFASVSYRLRTEATYADGSRYRFGDAALWSAHAQYRILPAVALDLGLDGRYAQADRAVDAGGAVSAAVENTGGTVLAAAPGLYFNPAGRLWMFARAQVPVWEHLFGQQDVKPTLGLGFQVMAL